MPNTSEYEYGTDPILVQAAVDRYVGLLLRSMPVEQLRQLVAEIEAELRGAKR